MTAPIIHVETYAQSHGPLTEGIARPFHVKVENPGPDALALESIRADGKRDGGFLWRKPPFGAVLYDAARDCYVHFTDATAIGPVAIEAGVVPPTSSAEAFVPVKSLEPGRRRVRLTLAYRVVPVSELARRLYLPPETMEARSTVYSLGRERAADAATKPLGRAILRAGDLERREMTVDAEIDATEDARAPGRIAAGVGRIVDRSRALGRAWVVAPEQGGLVALVGERRLDVGRVDPAVFAFVDELPIGEAIPLVLRGDRALAVVLPDEVSGRDAGQQWFEPDLLVSVLERILAAGLSVSVGAHGVAEVGLVAEAREMAPAF